MSYESQEEADYYEGHPEQEEPPMTPISKKIEEINSKYDAYIKPLENKANWKQEPKRYLMAIKAFYSVELKALALLFEEEKEKARKDWSEEMVVELKKHWSEDTLEFKLIESLCEKLSEYREGK